MAAFPMERMSVLVVDDNHHMTDILRTIFRGFGVKNLYEAGCVDSGFEIFCTQKIDVIVTDYQMQPVDGAELVRRIRTAPESPNPYAPVIMLTAYSDRSKVETARDAGITEFCAKPVMTADLYRKIVAAVNAPRPFIRTKSYFGPDRRRRRPDSYAGVERRSAELFGAPGKAAEPTS